MLNDPVWSYGQVKVFTSHDLGTTTQPEWSYGQAILQNEYPTSQNIYGVMFSYGETKKFTSEGYTLEPEFSYGGSILFHELFRVPGRARARLRAAYIWVADKIMRARRS